MDNIKLAVMCQFTAKCLLVNSHQSHLKPTGHLCTSDMPKKPATGEAKNLWQWQMYGSLVYCYRTQLVMKSATYQMCDLERFS